MDLDVQIEKNIPVPETRKRLNQKPWCDMQPGDSFFVRAHLMMPHAKNQLRKQLMYLGGKYWGREGYSVMAAERDGVQGFRVWRRK